MKDDALILSITALRGNSRLHVRQVDDRIQELGLLAEKKVKYKSQCGGVDTVYFVNQVSWPQNKLSSGPSWCKSILCNLTI